MSGQRRIRSSSGSNCATHHFTRGLFRFSRWPRMKSKIQCPTITFTSREASSSVRLLEPRLTETPSSCTQTSTKTMKICTAGGMFPAVMLSKKPPREPSLTPTSSKCLKRLWSASPNSTHQISLRPLLASSLQSINQVQKEHLWKNSDSGTHSLPESSSKTADIDRLIQQCCLEITYLSTFAWPQARRWSKIWLSKARHLFKVNSIYLREDSPT